MKTLAYDEVIEIGTASGHDASDASLLLASMGSMSGADLHTSYRQGNCACNTISLRGVPSYIVFWRKLEPDCLEIMGVRGIAMGIQDFEGLVVGCEDICQLNACRYARFHSIRRGMAAKILRHGGHVASVCYHMPNRKAVQ